MEHIKIPYKINSYYETPMVRENCHALKERISKESYEQALNTVTEYFISLNIVTKDDYLIPAPQHSGKAEYTLDIANRISEYTGAKVLDIVGRTPSETWYDIKKTGNTDIPHFFLKTDDIPEYGRLFFLDNVISTGMTYREISKLFKKDLIPLVYAMVHNYQDD